MSNSTSKHIYEAWHDENNSEKCQDCMNLEEEKDFWKECYNGKHSKPSDCPTYYDGCNCGGSLVEENMSLLESMNEMKKLLKVIYEADALNSWTHDGGDEGEESIYSSLRNVYQKYKLKKMIMK